MPDQLNNSNQQKQTGKGCCIAFVVVAVILVVWVVGCMNTPESPEQKAEDQKMMAWTMATNHFVKEELASPSTARFPYWDSEGVVVYDNGDDTYNILGYVDSQNGFGAMIRTKFSCKVQYNGGHSWTCLSLDFVE